MKKLLIYWFKVDTSRAAKKVLEPVFTKKQIQEVLQKYWERYLDLKSEVPVMPTLGGSLMVHLAVMSTAFYQELMARGQTEENATRLFYDIAWRVYKKLGRAAWWLAGWGNNSSYYRLMKATKIFRTFPFNSPSYQWKDIESEENVVRFDCLKCPVAEYFRTKGLSELCAATWCELDFPLADMWNARLERSQSIAGGGEKCDFKWISKTRNYEH